ncbi:MAG: cyclic-di-AMP receptor [Clostridium sp.]|nr:cyclic-di-AMP receptor [Clostridium sp.]
MLYCIKIRWDYPMEDKIMDMNLMLIIVQEKDAGPLAASFKKHKIQATRIDAEGLVSSRRLNVFLVGTDRVDEVLGLVEANCRERTIEMEDKEYNGHIFVDVQRTIVIGGATVFLMGEARLMKIKGLYNE